MAFCDSMDLLNSLTVSNATLDARMSRTIAKITGKRNEIDRIEEEIKKEQADLARIEQDLCDARSREDRLCQTVQGLHESKSMLENLKTSLETGVRTGRDGLDRIAKERASILTRYGLLSETYRTRYESLKSRRMLSAQKVDNVLLKVDVKKSLVEVQKYEAQIVKLKLITGLRLNKAVVGFAKLMLERDLLLRTRPRDLHFSEEKAALARSGVTLTVKKVPVTAGFTPIKARLGIKSAFTASSFWQERRCFEEFTPQASSSQNPLEYTFPSGTSISVVSPTVEDLSTTDHPSQKKTPFYQFF